MRTETVPTEKELHTIAAERWAEMARDSRRIEAQCVEMGKRLHAVSWREQAEKEEKRAGLFAALAETYND